MIRREIDGAAICLLTFDRPDSGANIFDAATLQDLSGHLDFIEKQPGLKGVILTSAKKSIFIAGAETQAGDQRLSSQRSPGIPQRNREGSLPESRGESEQQIFWHQSAAQGPQNSAGSLDFAALCSG